MPSLQVPTTARELISALLRPDLKRRLGAGDGGLSEVAAHAFFEGRDTLEPLRPHLHTEARPLAALFPSAFATTPTRSRWRRAVHTDAAAAGGRRRSSAAECRVDPTSELDDVVATSAAVRPTLNELACCDPLARVPACTCHRAGAGTGAPALTHDLALFRYAFGEDDSSALEPLTEHDGESGAPFLPRLASTREHALPPHSGTLPVLVGARGGVAGACVGSDAVGACRDSSTGTRANEGMPPPPGGAAALPLRPEPMEF